MHYFRFPTRRTLLVAALALTVGVAGWLVHSRTTRSQGTSPARGNLPPITFDDPYQGYSIRDGAVVGATGLVLAAHARAAGAAGEGGVKRSLLWILAAGAGLAVVPWLGLPAFYESILYLILHWIALATSWNLLSGYSGYFSFGHGAFFGIGMYTTATLATRFDVPFLWTLPAAAAVAAAFGALLGAVAFRVQAVRAELFSLLFHGVGAPGQGNSPAANAAWNCYLCPRTPVTHVSGLNSLLSPDPHPLPPAGSSGSRRSRRTTS